MMVLDKKVLSIEEIEAQTVLELPARETLLVTIVVTNVLNNLSVNIPVKNNNVAVQICAAIGALGAIGVSLTCMVDQRQ